MKHVYCMEFLINRCDNQLVLMVINMSNDLYIKRLGGVGGIVEILKYHAEYFNRYKYYDLNNRCFVKKVDDRRVNDFLLVSEIKSIYRNV